MGVLLASAGAGCQSQSSSKVWLLLQVLLADKCVMDKLLAALSACQGLEVVSLPGISCDKASLPSFFDDAGCLATLTSLSINYDLALECADRLGAASKLEVGSGGGVCAGSPELGGLHP